MTRVCFLAHEGRLCGFHMEGHAGVAKAGKDILCAAISSAAYLVANTLTEVYRVEAEISVEDGNMFLQVTEKGRETAAPLLEGLRLHLEGLSEQYPKHLTVQVRER